MAVALARAVQSAQLYAVVRSACVCGQPWTAHRAGATCAGYQPARPPTELGVVAYAHRSRACRWWWWFESFARARRTSSERRWSTRRSQQE